VKRVFSNGGTCNPPGRLTVGGTLSTRLTFLPNSAALAAWVAEVATLSVGVPSSKLKQ
jgi:hypothetical protein